MSTEQSEAFEKWWQANYADAPTSLGMVVKMVARRAWDVSRESLVVEIKPQPFYIMPRDNVPSDHYNAGIERVKKCIVTAGITVKE